MKWIIVESKNYLLNTRSIWFYRYDFKIIYKNGLLSKSSFPRKRLSAKFINNFTLGRSFIYCSDPIYRIQKEYQENILIMYEVEGK